MSDGLKIGLLITTAILVAILLYIYFSPYQTCIRAWKAQGGVNAEMHCYAMLSG